MTVDSDISDDELDEHYFHSPINSNAVITIVLNDELDLSNLKLNYLTHSSNYEAISLTDKVIKLKFFNKDEAQLLNDKLTKNFKNLDVKINFDTLTHPGNIYVRGLVPEVTTQDLFEIFKPFGEITSCKICFDEFGQSKGYGFINFTNGNSADIAIEKLNGLLINGSKFYLNHHIAKKERIERLLFEKQHFTNLYVKNIPASYDEEKINELFTKFGEINSLFLPEIENTQLKKFGFINYKNHESAVEAILNLDNKELEPDLFLSVSRAQRRDERKSPLNIPPTINLPQSQHQPKPLSPIPFQYTDLSGLPLPGPHQQQSNLYIKNLTQNITDDKLNQIFSPFGSIISAKIMTLEDGFTSRGFGFVCFKSVSEASRAMISMNGTIIDGEMVHVSFAQKNNKKLGKSQYNKLNNFIYYPINQSKPYYYGLMPPPPPIPNAPFDYNYQKFYKKKESLNEIINKILKLSSNEEKSNLILIEIIQPFLNKEKKNLDSLKFLEFLINDYDSKYDEFLNDLSNKELNLIEKLSQFQEDEKNAL